MNRTDAYDAGWSHTGASQAAQAVSSAAEEEGQHSLETALTAGAVAFVAKQNTDDELIGAIRMATESAKGGGWE